MCTTVLKKMILCFLTVMVLCIAGCSDVEPLDDGDSSETSSKEEVEFSDEYLVGFDVGYQLLNRDDIFFRHGIFLHFSRLIEWQVEEVDVVCGYAIVGTG